MKKYERFGESIFLRNYLWIIAFHDWQRTDPLGHNYVCTNEKMILPDYLERIRRCFKAIMKGFLVTYFKL